jgi:lipopolysaccharide biosynthesis glycosyltransferase
MVAYTVNHKSYKQPIIVCAADNRYAVPLAVMLRSMVENMKRYPVVQVWVLDGGISWLSKRRILKGLPGGKVMVQWIKPSNRMLKGVPVSGHVSICTYYRLVMTELLPRSVDKVIYLDVDTIILGDIGELWDVELGENALMAVAQEGQKVSDPYGLAMYQELGLAPDAPYFNAGVLLVNVDRWRAMEFSRLAANFVGKYKSMLHFWDQDILNGVLSGAWSPLAAKWNVGISQLWRGDIMGMLQDPGKISVMHFASAIKPWDYGVEHTAREMYFQWVDHTAWSGWRPVKPIINWKTLRNKLSDRHWYGQMVRTLPGVGGVWGVFREWWKKQQET